MKQILLPVIILIHSALLAQKAPTETINITGEVERDVTITVADIRKLESMALPDLPVTSHTGELHGTAKGLRGVSLKLLLERVTIKSKSPKDLSELFFILEASDGYRVVYSWNELYNSPAGDHVWVIVEKEGKTLGDMPEQILVVAQDDIRTGRRYIKSLAKITVRRI